MNEQSLVQRRSDAARRYWEDHFVEPFARLREEFGQLIDDIPARWPAPYPAGRIASFAPFPAIEMSEADDAYTVSVEVPGVAEEDIDLSVRQNMLIVKGEKREQHEERDDDFSRSERIYGSFERRLRLPDDAKTDDIAAVSRNGVLTITVPRDPDGKNASRHIPVRAEAAS